MLIPMPPLIYLMLKKIIYFYLFIYIYILINTNLI
jgi:hypothetical protein